MRVFLRMILPVTLVVFVVDRLTKLWIVEGMNLEQAGRIEVIPGFFNLIMAWNRGINFGLGSGTSPMILIGIAIGVSLALTFWTMRKGRMTLGLGTGLVVGGALGNAWDRATHWRAVADFLNVTCCGIHNPYSFNIADIAIFAGAVWIAVKA